MAETMGKSQHAEEKLAGLRRVLRAIRAEYRNAREQGASDAELAVIEETGTEVSARIQRGEEYVAGQRGSEEEGS